MKIKEKLKSESGNTVIEATFVVTIVIIIVCVLIIFGFLFYQQSLVQSTASKVSTDIAKSYKRESADPIINYTSEGDLRHSFDENNYYIQTLLQGIIPSSYNNKKINLSEWYAQANLNKSRFMSTIDNGQKIKAEIKPSKLVAFQNEINVEISETYEIPLLKLLGVSDPQMTFSGKAISVCTDMTGFYSFDNFLIPYINSLIKKSGVDSIADFIKVLFDDEKDILDVISVMGTDLSDLAKALKLK